ncbi:hypothetical protein SAMN04488055_5790 [Chitinophaga niabensis]|uniref:DUF7710 domain-containing protein n=2 Tax=Chitinophaga niabensis TaxID=536979 RepID=A0A1N6KG99_9BACT|nr:hypothetical protein SAMN04488055_5790 [Chitinophaga niabensis]
MPEYVWVFNGDNSRFSSGVFQSMEKAEEWIAINRLSGILTKYPLDTGVYEWAIQNRLFSVKKEEQKHPAFIGRFTSASLDHFHYENGKKDDATAEKQQSETVPLESLPKIFADFNNNDTLGRIRLNTNGTMRDLAKLNIKLEEGLVLLLDDTELSTRGVVQFSEIENIWVVVVDWDHLHNQ